MADDAYLRQAIRSPREVIRRGFPALMPPNDLDDAAIDSIIAYIAELAGGGASSTASP